MCDARLIYRTSTYLPRPGCKSMYVCMYLPMYVCVCWLRIASLPLGEREREKQEEEEEENGATDNDVRGDMSIHHTLQREKPRDMGGRVSRCGRHRKFPSGCPERASHTTARAPAPSPCSAARFHRAIATRQPEDKDGADRYT